MTAASIARRALEELPRVTGLEADSVSAVDRNSDTWQVTVNLVELRRIPSATDVLAAYDAILDEDGNLMSYHRTRRYLRDQVGETL